MSDEEREHLMTETNTNSEPTPHDTLVLSRQVFTRDEFDQKYPLKEKVPFSFTDTVKRKCTGKCVINALLAFFPIISFVRTYKPRAYILGDALSGLTVGFLSLPMGLGFGILAGLQPVHGLFTSFFPALAYMVFGTSPYISMGSNAVMALLTQTVVEREEEAYIAAQAALNASVPTDQEVMDVKVGSAMACCFIAGFILMGMGVLKLGVLTTYMSVSFVGGFTTAAAVHIASSQVPKMFGIKVNTYAGAGKLVLMYIDLFRKIATTNAAEIITCILCMIVLLLVKICINERYSKKMKMPIPIDLLVVIAGTIISHFADFKTRFDVKVAGEIPSGFLAPALPRLERAGSFASDAFVMAILSLMMTMSMAKLCARKHGMPIDDNQELIAYGASNVLSSFFFSFPSATAPPRSMLQSSLGSRSTLNAITTLIFILLVILVIGPLFENLPLSVLAAMIIVSMKELLLQYRNLPRIWRVNKYDFIIWTVTNAVSVLVDLNYGIIAGLGISIFLVVIKDQCASGKLISVAKDEDVLIKACVKNEDNKMALGGIRIFKITTSLYFATADRIKSQIFKTVLNPKNLEEKAKSDTIEVNLSGAPEKPENINGTAGLDDESNIHSIIIDCSSVSYIDMGGIGVLLLIVNEYKKINVSVYLVGLTEDVLTTLTEGDFFKTFQKTDEFLDVFDAISFITKDKKISVRF